MMKNFTISSAGIFGGRLYHTLLTNFFSHRDSFHFLMNMLVFSSFAQNALSVLGAYRFCVLYFCGGLLSSVAQIAWPFVVPKSWPAYYSVDYYQPALGASGAINALLMWHIATFPRSIIYIYAIVPIPAAFLGVGFVAMDGFSLYKGDSNIGNAAHLGGAFFGIFYFFITRGKIRHF
jgi:membrane associated rhomboid family serine protease